MFDTDKLNKIKDRLTQKQETLSVAESVTSGLLQAAFASAEMATDFFQGGITAYNIGQKCRHLYTDPVQALKCNCVSENIARTMACNVCNLFTSHWGIAITGYATPVPESGNKVYAYYAIAYKGEPVLYEKLEGIEGNALDVQLDYVDRIIQSFLKLKHP